MSWVEARAMILEPWTINSRLINALFDHQLSIVKEFYGEAGYVCFELFRRQPSRRFFSKCCNRNMLLEPVLRSLNHKNPEPSEHIVSATPLSTCLPNDIHLCLATTWGIAEKALSFQRLPKIGLAKSPYKMNKVHGKPTQLQYGMNGFRWKRTCVSWRIM